MAEVVHYGKVKEDLNAIKAVDLGKGTEGQFRFLLLRVLHSIANDLNSISFRMRGEERK